MRELTSEGRRVVEDLAQRHGVSLSAVQVLLRALAEGGGTQAQFNHPELGGLGQWSQGGMLMIGDMFNQGLKARVDALCVELARRLRTETLLTPAAPSPSSAQVSWSGSGGSSWPAELGTPSSSGSQGDLRYAYFPERRRLALQQGGRMTIYDTGEHRISGVSQQQGAGQSLTFTSQLGVVRLGDLPVIGPAPTASADRPSNAEDPLAQIERLAELHKKGILTQEEFAAKKAELLSRL
jgi:hypothetical protein